MSGTATSGFTYPYVMLRVYFCGHPQEWIEVDKIIGTQPKKLKHTLMSQNEPPKGTMNSYLFTLERCPRCAAGHQAQRLHQHPSEPIRTTEANQGEVRGEETWVKDGFLHVLRRQRFGAVGRYRRRIYWPDERERSSAYYVLRSIDEEVRGERGPLKMHERFKMSGYQGNEFVQNSDGSRWYEKAQRHSQTPLVRTRDIPAESRLGVPEKDWMTCNPKEPLLQQAHAPQTRTLRHSDGAPLPGTQPVSIEQTQRPHFPGSLREAQADRLWKWGHNSEGAVRGIVGPPLSYSERPAPATPLSISKMFGTRPARTSHGSTNSAESEGSNLNKPLPPVPPR